MATAPEAVAATTEKAARRRLQSSGYAALKAISCRFRRGTLILTGRAPNYFHKQLAQEAVRTLAAVEAIHNDIVVAPKTGAGGRARAASGV